MAAILKACNDGDYNLVKGMVEYRDKANAMKMFTDNGFKIVYDKDEDQPLSDGFYFTISYPGFSGEELLAELCIMVSVHFACHYRQSAIRRIESLRIVDSKEEFPSWKDD